MYQPIHKAFRPLIGLPAWSVRRGHGSFLTLEFGSPRPDVHQPHRGPRLVGNTVVERIVRREGPAPRGEWHLWIYLSSWSVHRNDHVVGTSDGPLEAIDSAAAVLEGQALRKVEVLSAPLTTLFHFDRDSTLWVTPYEVAAAEPEELWLLYEPEGMVLTLRADAHYSHVPGDSTDDRWLPLPEPW